jgi:hypothetical protein
MKIISNLATAATCADDGKPCPKFPPSGNLHGKTLSKCFTGAGVMIYSRVTKQAVFIPDAELDALAIKHEPKLVDETPKTP